jgi:hypothetical protein
MTIKFANHKNEAERQIIVLLVEDCLAAGYALGVNDGEETTLEDSTDEEKIFAAMSTTDEDFLILNKRDEAGEILDKGWIRLVYGNDGYVISNYTVNLEPIVDGGRVAELAARFQ